MITLNKIILYLSLALNFNLIFVFLTIIFIWRKGGISYVSNKLSFLMPPNQSSELSLKPKRKLNINTYQTTYHKAKNKIFQQLPNSDIDGSNQLNPNYTDDGVHLNGKGYLLWGNLIQKYFEK